MSTLIQILQKVICSSVSDKQQDFTLDEAVVVQKKILKYLIRRAKFTAFGEHYRFQEMIGKNDLTSRFKKSVPIHTYRDMYVRWWYRLLNGESYVTWPGKQKYFLTKGLEQEDGKKAIPVSRSIINSYCVTGRRFLSEFPEKDEEVAGSADLELDFNKIYYGGSLAAIIAHHKPIKYHCCFRTLFLPDSGELQNRFLITEIGWIGIRTKTLKDAYQLIVDNDLYYEFIPFNKNLPDRKGLQSHMKDTLTLEDVENNKDYAVLLTNNSGAWRYFTCYIIRFIDKAKLVFTVTQKVKVS